MGPPRPAAQGDLFLKDIQNVGASSGKMLQAFVPQPMAGFNRFNISIKMDTPADE